MARVSKKSKRRLMTFGIVSIFAIGYFCFTLIGYIYNYVSLRNEENNLKNELLFLQDEKASLKVEIQKLNDPAYVIRYAKEKFLYSTDGEYVIKLNQSNEVFNNNVKDDSIVPIIITSIIIFVLLLLFIRFKPYKLLKKQNL